MSGGGDTGLKVELTEIKLRDLPISGVNDDRDDLEKKLLDRAFERKMPVLGICRGMQVMNVFFKSTFGQISVKEDSMERFIARVRAVNLQ